jgi:hypothetical protein
MRLHRKGVAVGVCAVLAARVVMAVARVGARATTTTRQATGGTLNAGVPHSFTGQNASFRSNAGGFRDSGSAFKEQGLDALRFHTRTKTVAVAYGGSGA